MIAENLKTVRNNIEKAAETCGRDPKDIKLVAVSKRFPAKTIAEALSAGQHLFGENYIQELKEKHDQLGAGLQFHFIGHLQSNKAKIAAHTCTMVETVDRIKVARELHKHLTAIGKKLDILVQVNIGSDKNKSGTSPEKAEELLRGIKELSMLRAVGLMTMPPFTENPEDARPFFKGLRELGNTLMEKELFHDNRRIELSMGMSNDYHIAIEEGSTIIRVGTAIFGQRQPPPHLS